MSSQLEKLANLKKYIEYLEDYYKNPSSIQQDISAETNAAVEQMSVAVAKINSKFDYTETIFDKLYHSIKTFGQNKLEYEYGDHSNMFDITINKHQKQIKSTLYVPFPGMTLYYDFIFIIQHNITLCQEPSNVDYSINVTVFADADNKPNYSPDFSNENYKCSPFTDFDDLLLNICQAWL